MQWVFLTFLALERIDMSGDHNMNQFTYGKAIIGGEHNITQKQDIEHYKSQIERQCVEMQCTLDLLKATVETLRMRLKPVIADAPMRTAINTDSKQQPSLMTLPTLSKALRYEQSKRNRTTSINELHTRTSVAVCFERVVY